MTDIQIKTGTSPNSTRGKLMVVSGYGACVEEIETNDLCAVALRRNNIRTHGQINRCQISTDFSRNQIVLLLDMVCIRVVHGTS